MVTENGAVINGSALDILLRMLMVVACWIVGVGVPQRDTMLPWVRHGPSPEEHEQDAQVRLLSLAHVDTLALSMHHVACDHEAGGTNGPT